MHTSWRAPFMLSPRWNGNMLTVPHLPMASGGARPVSHLSASAPGGADAWRLWNMDSLRNKRISQAGIHVNELMLAWKGVAATLAVHAGSQRAATWRPSLTDAALCR